MEDKQKHLDVKFTYHEPKEDSKELFTKIRELGRAFAEYVDDNCPKGRESSLAVTKIEEAIMWANAGVARSHPKEDN